MLSAPCSCISYLLPPAEGIRTQGRCEEAGVHSLGGSVYTMRHLWSTSCSCARSCWVSPGQVQGKECHLDPESFRAFVSRFLRSHRSVQFKFVPRRSDFWDLNVKAAFQYEQMTVIYSPMYSKSRVFCFSPMVQLSRVASLAQLLVLFCGLTPARKDI